MFHVENSEYVIIPRPLLPLTQRIDLEEWEHVTCMKTVALRSQETVSGLKGYIAAGTCLMQGEEVTCRGRVRRALVAVPPESAFVFGHHRLTASRLVPLFRF